MAEGTNLGKAYFTLVPSMAGTAAAIERELGGTKVKNSGTAAGRGIGSKMVSGMGAGIMAGATALGGVAAAAATAAAAGIGGMFAEAIDLSVEEEVIAAAEVAEAVEEVILPEETEGSEEE